MILIIRTFQTLSGVWMFICILMMALAWMTDSPSFEQIEAVITLLGATVLFVMISVFLTYALELCFMKKYAKEIKNDIRNKIKEKVPSFQFDLYYSMYQELIIKPLVPDESK